MLIDFSFRGNLVFFQILCITQQNRSTEFVIQETAFDITAFRNADSGLESHEIPFHYAKGKNIFPGVNFFVQKDFHDIKAS